jgi:hypothetical protein
MTFTAEAYFDIIDAMEADYREPRPPGKPSRVDEAIASHGSPFAVEVPAGWMIYAGTPARMAQQAAARTSRRR